MYLTHWCILHVSTILERMPLSTFGISAVFCTRKHAFGNICEPITLSATGDDSMQKRDIQSNPKAITQTNYSTANPRKPRHGSCNMFRGDVISSEVSVSDRNHEPIV